MRLPHSTPSLHSFFLPSSASFFTLSPSLLSFLINFFLFFPSVSFLTSSRSLLPSLFIFHSFLAFLFFLLSFLPSFLTYFVSFLPSFLPPSISLFSFDHCSLTHIPTFSCFLSSSLPFFSFLHYLFLPHFLCPSSLSLPYFVPHFLSLSPSSLFYISFLPHFLVLPSFLLSFHNFSFLLTLASLLTFLLSLASFHPLFLSLPFFSFLPHCVFLPQFLSVLPSCLSFPLSSHSHFLLLPSFLPMSLLPCVKLALVIITPCSQNTKRTHLLDIHSFFSTLATSTVSTSTHHNLPFLYLGNKTLH